MPHPLPAPDPARAWWLAILETCPPGEALLTLLWVLLMLLCVTIMIVRGVVGRGRRG